jgi:hypothetical protein
MEGNNSKNNTKNRITTARPSLACIQHHIFSNKSFTIRKEKEACDKTSPKHQWYYYLYTRRLYAGSSHTWESLKTCFHSKRTAETNRKGLINKIKPQIR